MTAIARNSDVEVARLFHELTKHSYTSVRTGDYRLDWENEPFKFKLYPELPALALPRDISLPATSALDALYRRGQKGSGNGRLDVNALARILFCAGGITRKRRVGGLDYHFRAAPSAGALYPIEIYVASRAIEGLKPALYHFSPGDLSLRALRGGDWLAVIEGAAAGAPSISTAQAAIILSAIFWRSAWKYRARAYRYCFWDAGTILANLTACAAAEDVQAEVLTAFVDRELENLLDIDGEREGVVCVVPLTTEDFLQHKQAAPAKSGSGDTVVSPHVDTPSPLGLETVPLSQKERVYEELVRLHLASKLQDHDEVKKLRAATINPAKRAGGGDRFVPLPRQDPSKAGLRLGEVILRRGTTRAYASEAITSLALATMLEASLRLPRCDFPRLSDIYLIVSAVEGISPGAYFYDAERHGLVLLKEGEFRREAAYLALEQGFVADASVLFCYMADLECVTQALGNRGYRNAHLEAGMLAGAVYLVSYALGLGASGLTFYDDDATEFFSPHAAGKSPLLMVAAGVPRKASKA